MGKEIERKFLVIRDDYRGSAKPNLIRQGYLCNEADRVIRVRIFNEQGFLTIKGRTDSITRAEYEYPIPYQDAEELMRLCLGTIIEKVRYEVNFRGWNWEVDEFHGQNQGLVVAEIELETENDTFAIPDWIGNEVTSDPKYLNANLVKKPFQSW